MDQYIKDLSYVIQNGDMENTYKTVWIRSIVETCCHDPNTREIHFDTLSKKIFGYYWNQTIYFDLEQSPNPKKRPGIYQLVCEEINKFRNQHGSKPEWFSKIESKITIPEKKISTILSKDVCWRFLKVGNENFDLYELDKEKRTVTLKNSRLISEYSDLLFDIINYRWIQKLEEFNNSPRISKKVKGTDREKVKRGNLKKFQKYLDIENPEQICFISKQPIKKNKLSIDHVIPWSYLYSDNLWNLVYVDKDKNSSKGNKIPSESTIKKLEKRNKKLSKLINQKNFKDKNTEELELSIEKDWVNIFWVGCKG